MLYANNTADYDQTARVLTCRFLFPEPPEGLNQLASWSSRSSVLCFVHIPRAVPNWRTEAGLTCTYITRYVCV